MFLSTESRALFWCSGQNWCLQAAANGLCFQSINTSCETCRQEAGSSRKLMLETEAQLGGAPERGLTHLRDLFY